MSHRPHLAIDAGMMSVATDIGARTRQRRYRVAMAHPEVIDPRHPLVERVRGICLSYPEATEVMAWGRPTFRAGKRMFVTMGSSMARPFAIEIKPPADDRLALLDDDRFFVPAYSGPSGWLGIDVAAADTDWTEIAELIDASYRGVALKRQLAALDASTS